MAEAAAIAAAETLDAADQLGQIDELERTIAALEAGQAQLRDGSIATDAAGLTMQHESLLKTLRAIDAAEAELGHTRAVSRARIDDVRKLASQVSGCPGELMREPRHSCRVRPSKSPRAGTSELWSGAVPCGPWGAAFSAKMQTFECPAPCPGVQCGQGGVVAAVVLFGPVRLEIVGHVLTVHNQRDGSSKTLKNTLRGKYHVGNGTTVEHGCPGQGGGGPGKEEADAYGCWTVEHLSGVSFSTRVSARTDTRSHFTIDLQMTVPGSLASGAPCSKDALVTGGEPQPLASMSAELLPSPSPSARPRRALSAARSRHHHTLLAARDYTANALDDKDWPVLRTPDMDAGLSLFAPRVLEGVSSMCDAP